MGQCTAKSKRSGERCRNHAVHGKTVCHIHGGKSSGAPKGNKNALTCGAYESISLATMSPEEIAYAQSVTLDPSDTLKEQLRILRVKQMRIEMRMKKALDAEALAGKDDGTGKKAPVMVVLSGTNVVTRNAEGAENKTVSTSSETHEMHYLRLEAAHNIVLEQIRRVTEAIAKISALDDENNDVPASIEIQVVDASVNRDEDDE